MQNFASGSFLSRFMLTATLRAGRLSDFITRYRIWIQSIVGIGAFALGFWGWSIERPATNLSEIVDNLFRTAQLITLQFPTDFRGAISLPLQIARLALPIVALLASFQVLLGAITRPARLALLPRTSDHLVVCGFEALTEAALVGLLRRGQQVVVVVPKIEAERRDQLEGLGFTVVVGEPLQATTIKSLHLSHAAAFFLTGSDDVKNLNIAMLAVPAAADRPRQFPQLVLAILIDREELAVELDAALDELSHRYNVRYHRLCPARDGIRSELIRFAPILEKGSPNLRSHVLIVGIANNWRQVVAQVIAAAQDHPEMRPLLTFIVDDSEAGSIERWHSSTPELDLVLEIEILRRQVDDLLPSDDIINAWQTTHLPPHLVVVLRNDADGIATTLALRRPANKLGTASVPILVHQTNEDRLLSCLGEIQVRGWDTRRLVAIGGLIREDSIERVLDHRGDEIAMDLHAHYLANKKTLDGDASSAAFRIWDELPENLRDANRAVVDHSPILFAAAGLQITAAGSDAKPVTISEAELDVLARVEHRRWVVDRINRGWRHASARDDDRKLHPSLVAYDTLSDTEKEKDKDKVRVLIATLEKKGLSIVRKRQ